MPAAPRRLEQGSPRPSNPHRGTSAPSGSVTTRLAQQPAATVDRGRPEQLGFGGAPGELLAQRAEEGGGEEGCDVGEKEHGGGDIVQWDPHTWC